MAKKMRLVVIVPVGKEAYAKEIDFADLKEMQEIVGGYIERVPLHEKGLMLIANEEGQYTCQQNMPLKLMGGYPQMIYGQFIICGKRGEWCGLKQEKADELVKRINKEGYMAFF